MCLVMRKTLLSILDKQRNMLCGNVRNFVTLSIIYWAIYLLDLALKYIDKC